MTVTALAVMRRPDRRGGVIKQVPSEVREDGVEILKVHCLGLIFIIIRLITDCSEFLQGGGSCSSRSPEEAEDDEFRRLEANLEHFSKDKIKMVLYILSLQTK